MTDREALHAAICANPDEDTPRLAFADYLQEQGGKENLFRADYIRGAIQLSREELWSPAWKKAEEAFGKFEAKVGRQMADGKLAWVKHLKGRVRSFLIDRGFVDHITVYSKRFVAEAEKFFEQDPIRSVRFVSLTSPSGTVPAKQLFACPHLARVSKLSLDNSVLKDDDLALMGKCKHLAGVRSLSLGEEQRFSPEALVKLLQALPAVDEFHMPMSFRANNPIATALAESKAFGKLHSLDFTAHELGSKGIAAILTSKHGANLRELRLSAGFADLDEYSDEDEHYAGGEWRLSEKDGKIIAAALKKAHFPNLRFLDLAGCRIGDAGLTAIAGSGFPALHQLDVEGNELTLEGLKVLADSPLGKQLVYLSLGFDESLQDDKVMKRITKMFPNARVTGYDRW